MVDEAEALRPTSPDDIRDALAFALRFDGRNRARSADALMAQITAERLVEHLRLSGFVVMKKPPAKAHSTPKTRE
jgi:hypothetical protein